jgi:hypothetical protein
MRVRSAATSSQGHPWLLGVSMASAVCVAYLVQVMLSWSSVPDRSLYSNLGMIPIGFAATIVARSAALAQGDARSQWGWRLIGAAFACYCGGDILFFVYQNVLGQSPFPSLADAGYLVYYPLLLAGLLFLPRQNEKRGRLGLRAAVCAVLVLGGGAAVFEWLLLPALQSSVEDRFAFALSVGYPLGDLLLLAGIAWTLFRRVAGRRSTVLLLTAGVCVGLVADLVYGYQTIKGTSQPGGLSDALFMVSWACYAWAAYAAATRQRVHAPVAQPAPEGSA